MQKSTSGYGNDAYGYVEVARRYAESLGYTVQRKIRSSGRSCRDRFVNPRTGDSIPMDIIWHDENGNVIPLSTVFTDKFFASVAKFEADYYAAFRRGDLKTCDAMMDAFAKRQGFVKRHAYNSTRLGTVYYIDSNDSANRRHGFLPTRTTMSEYPYGSERILDNMQFAENAHDDDGVGTGHVMDDVAQYVRSAGKQPEAQLAEKEAREQTEQQTDAATAGEVRSMLIGTNDNGIEVYETSKETKGLTWKQRIAKYLDLMQNQYAGRTARFLRNGHFFYAVFDKDDLRKPVYGDKRSGSKAKKSLINTLADGDVFDLVEDSQYLDSAKDTKNHKNTDYFDYFAKTVQIDGKVFDIRVDVKKQYSVDGGYTYTIKLVENSTIKASPAVAPIEDAIKGAGNASDASKPQTPESVKPESASTQDSMQQNGETIRYSLNIPEAQRALAQLEEGDLNAMEDMMSDMKNVGRFALLDPSRMFDKCAGKNKKLRNFLRDKLEQPHLEAEGKYAREYKKAEKCVMDSGKAHGIVDKKGVLDKKKSAAVQRIGEGYCQRPCKVEVELIDDRSGTYRIKATDEMGNVLIAGVQETALYDPG